MTEPKTPVKIEPVDEVAETVTTELTPPDPDPVKIVTTERKTPIKRSMPLTESHGMTTEANRFRSS